MTNTTVILRAISNEYDIPYTHLIKLINNLDVHGEKPKKSSKKKSVYEFITIQGQEYLYKEKTNTIYTFDAENPLETRCKYGFLVPETLEIISTNGL